MDNDENTTGSFSLDNAPGSALADLLVTKDENVRERLFTAARKTALSQFGNKIYIRGLIEFTNFCTNDCFYCGIRCANKNVKRYRLTNEQILACCHHGYALGFRTFVLQGGEDPFFTDEALCTLIRSIKKKYPDCALTLSIGERSRASYRALFDAGCDRYLLRHETANEKHYARLHPPKLSLASRLDCLSSLKEIGYQVGMGFMVGSPFQTIDNIVEDLLFIKSFKPQMIGIGPFIPHHDTPFRDHKAGTLELTLRSIAILRLLMPKALIPATTALGTIAPEGREQGILAGANVVMPNLSPPEVRENYSLYDNKIYRDEESAEGLASLKAQMEKIGYNVVVDRGDYQA